MLGSWEVRDDDDEEVMGLFHTWFFGTVERFLGADEDVDEELDLASLTISASESD